jgi:hypothetical protein
MILIFIENKDINYCSYEELKKEYQTRKIGCKNWLGKIYVPGHIDYRELPILKKTLVQIPELTIKDKKYYDVKFTKKELKDPEYYKEYINDKINDLTCKNFICKPCRNILKNNLHLNILREVYNKNLIIHMVFTFPGLSERKKINYAQSFKMVNNDYKKLIKCIKYEWKKLLQGKKSKYKNKLFIGEIPKDPLSYICLPRAQSKPEDDNPIGFCHLHVIMNWQLNIKWIYECIKKNNYKLGFCFVRKNQSVADYLCKDYFEDDEWVIPKNVKHYHTSKDIILNISKGSILDPGIKFIKNTTDVFPDPKKQINDIENKNRMLVNVLEDQLKNNYTNYEIFGKNLKVFNPKILPFEEYLKMFVDCKSETKEVFNYGSLKRFNFYNKKHNDFYNKYDN